MSTTRRTLLKLLSALPFAGVVGLRRKPESPFTESGFMDEAPTLLLNGCTNAAPRPILARLEEWYESWPRPWFGWDTELKRDEEQGWLYYPCHVTCIDRPTRIHLTRAEVEEFDRALWRELYDGGSAWTPTAEPPQSWLKRPAYEAQRTYRGIPIVEAERSDLDRDNPREP